jgi:hypothetical protein
LAAFVIIVAILSVSVDDVLSTGRAALYRRAYDREVINDDDALRANHNALSLGSVRSAGELK